MNAIHLALDHAPATENKNGSYLLLLAGGVIELQVTGVGCDLVDIRSALRIREKSAAANPVVLAAFRTVSSRSSSVAMIRAAAYEETTVSRFVLTNAVAAAERVIEAHEKIVLPATDWDAFHEALLDPPAPNRELRRAALRYRERVGQ